MAGSQGKPADRRPSEYAREAVAEWGKAARYGARALAPVVRNATKNVTAGFAERRSERGGKAGDLADAALSKLGVGGKLASKVGVGSRVVEGLRGGGDGEPASGTVTNGDGFSAHGTIPIQESIEVAVPAKAAYALATSFEEYPEWSDHVASVDSADDSHLTFLAKVRGRRRELEVEIADERPNERLDWRCGGGLESSGVVSFHELAPRLTHIELTVEFEPEGMVERLTRSTRLSERAIRAELHRFKAYADLWEPEEGEEPDAEDEEAPVDEEELEEGEPVDEEELEDEDELEDDEEPVDEEELDEGEDFEDEEPVDEEELDEGEDFEDEEPVDEEELEDEDELEDDEELVDEEELDEGEEEPEPATAER
jgi:uncharacterized membrane protein